METLRKYLCRIGIHAYSPWQSSNVDLVPMGGSDELAIIESFFAPDVLSNAVNTDTLQLETQFKECRCCNHTKVRQFVKW